MALLPGHTCRDCEGVSIISFLEVKIYSLAYFDVY